MKRIWQMTAAEMTNAARAAGVGYLVQVEDDGRFPPRVGSLFKTRLRKERPHLGLGRPCSVCRPFAHLPGAHPVKMTRAAAARTRLYPEPVPKRIARARLLERLRAGWALEASRGAGRGPDA